MAGMPTGYITAGSCQSRRVFDKKSLKAYHGALPMGPMIRSIHRLRSHQPNTTSQSNVDQTFFTTLLRLHYTQHYRSHFLALKAVYHQGEGEDWGKPLPEAQAGTNSAALSRIVMRCLKDARDISD